MSFFDCRCVTDTFHNGDHYTIISESEMQELKSIDAEIRKLNEKKRVLKSQIIAQLLKLRTYAKIERDFPEAFVLLPNREVINLPAYDIKQILSDIENA